MRDEAIVEALKRTSLPQCQPICRKPGTAAFCKPGTATTFPAPFAGNMVAVPGFAHGNAPCRLRLALLVLIQITEPVHFSLEDLVEHRRLKISSWKHLRNTRLLVILSSPLIYLCVLPFLLLDASVALYQLVCFPDRK